MTAFQKNSLQRQLDGLKNNGVINNEQALKLMEIYEKDSRDFTKIFDEVKSFMFNQELLKEVLEKNTVINGTKVSDMKLEEKTTPPLSLENITDFRKDGKDYVKIHYPYPDDTIKIVENNAGVSSEELFNYVKDKSDLLSVDGMNNSAALFEQELLQRNRELEVSNLIDLTISSEFSKLTSEQKKVVVGTIKAIIASLPLPDEDKEKLYNENCTDLVKKLSNMLGKNFFVSPEDNIIVVTTPNSHMEDEIKTMNSSLDGNTLKYELKPLDSKSYHFNSEYSQNVSESSDETQMSSENESYEVSDEADIDKEMGPALSLKRNKKKNKNNNAAFINELWFVIAAGVLMSLWVGNVVLKVLFQ